MNKFFRKIKYFYQKHTRGFSDEDLRNLDYYLAKHIKECLIEFKKVSSGYPANTIIEKWNKDLDDMIDVFEYFKNIESIEYNEEEVKKMTQLGYKFIDNFNSLWY